MRFILSVFLLSMTLLTFGGQPHKDVSVLEAGTWYKVAIQETGIHKITYEDFVAMGFDLAAIADSTIRVFGNGAGMLPEPNATPRIDDLQEIAIILVDGNDGRINPGDYVIFYGEAPDKWTFDYAATHLFSHTKNLYSDYSYYFINAGLKKGKRVDSEPSLDTIPNHIVTKYDDFACHDQDQYNLIKSGRTWYGEEFDNSTNSYGFSFSFPGIDTSSPIRVVTNVAARAGVVSKFYLSSDDKAIDSISVDYTDMQNTQNFGQVKQKVTFFHGQSSPLNLNLAYSLPSPNSLGWLNFIEVTCRRNLHRSEPQFGFRDAGTIGKNSISQFIISGVDQNMTVLDITNRSNIRKMEGVINHDTLTFITRTDTLKEFHAFDGSFFYPVRLVEAVPCQNLHGLDPATLVIVTHPLFLEQARRLAVFHHEHNDLSVIVAQTTEVYNEFASGNADLTAIRDFVKLLYDRSSSSAAPKYLLLFGDGSYDPKDRIPGNNNMIPTFQSVESMSMIQSYVTDDYFGIMGDNEGLASNGSIDVGIGRFPVTTVEQAETMVDKIIHYSSVSDSILSDWKNRMTFVADDENSNLHLQQAEQLAKIVNERYPAYNVNKVYFDAFQLISTPAGERFPDANKAINKVVEDGSLIINYTGHGGEDGWSGEKCLTVGDIEKWTNADKLPVFITATCEFSRFDNPDRFSAGEIVINHPNGGAIALYSTTRQAMATSNFKLDTSFFSHLIPPAGQPVLTMGDLIRISKNNNSNNSNIRNFVLLGDPAQEIAFPKYRVVTTEVNNNPAGTIPDTVLGLSVLNVKGIVVDQSGNKVESYNGTLHTRLFDKTATFRTLGNKPGANGSYPQNFQLQNSLLTYNKATVKNGAFEFSCVVPKDINLRYGKGKLSYYCHDDSTDANGYLSNIVIGGTDPSVNPENAGPEIRLYMENRNFASGGRTSSNPWFIADLRDDDGINSVGLGIGHELLAVLDKNSSSPVVLNDFYEPDLDNYRSGTLQYQLRDLSTGYHTISLKAWDMYNNSSETEISFFVMDQPLLTVQQVLNFPNPFRGSTTFQLSPLQNAGTLDIQIRISSVTGSVIKTIEKKVSEYGNQPIYIPWDGRTDNGNAAANGIYIYKLVVKGGNGSSSQTSQKLIIMN